LGVVGSPWNYDLRPCNSVADRGGCRDGGKRENSAAGYSHSLLHHLLG
jgi:hypothetical protein